MQHRTTRTRRVKCALLAQVDSVGVQHSYRLVEAHVLAAVDPLEFIERFWLGSVRSPSKAMNTAMNCITAHVQLNTKIQKCTQNLISRTLTT